MSFFVCLDVDMDSTSMTVFMLSPMQKPKIHRHTEHVKLCLHLSLLSDMHINYPCLHFAYKHIEKKHPWARESKQAHHIILENLVLDLFLYGLHVKW